ncbi:hypothetical protein EFK50_16610 [Nocardioides marmoriginsengisoli]|uniref:Uncharacterized protein n=1 Tax=Nocardioides marmoriginsengisoli TaxID=661483 RepID=A0A3N0CC39_9ACTN|nr:hypothetical protein [Nocardioides marmoriginsengisoli]RNL61008.1 hypothetical protein EFK50_16610 [Nocardioides marmoriginsengisoli]
MSSPRWDRLVEALAAAGVDTKVDEKPYAESVRGRVQNGVSRSITILREDTGPVTINDTWAPRAPDTWNGWQVWAEDADGIATFNSVRTKARSTVVLQVLGCLTDHPQRHPQRARAQAEPELVT